MRAWSVFVLTCVARADITHIGTDEAFEAEIMNSAHVWAVLFTSTGKEDAIIAEKLVDRLSVKLSSVKFAVADVDSVKAFASEFNVRKRMVPRLAVFASRARQADLVPMKGDSMPTSEDLEKSIMAFLSENSKVGGLYEKLTLAIGGGSDEL